MSAMLESPPSAPSSTSFLALQGCPGRPIRRPITRLSPRPNDNPPPSVKYFDWARRR